MQIRSSWFTHRIQRVCLMLSLTLVGLAMADAYDIDFKDSINDRAMYRAFERKAGELIEAEAFTENEVLQKQLERRNVSEPIEWPVVDSDEVLTGPQVYRCGSAATVLMGGVYDCGHCDKWHVRPATGFVVHPRGLVVTNHHVVQNDSNKTMAVMTRDGRVFGVSEVLAASEADDVALVRLAMDEDDADLAFLPIGKREPVGGKVYVVSHPTRQFFTFTDGMVSRYVGGRNRNEPTDRMIITADYAKGSSGGPVINDRGEVVGVVSSTRSIYYNREEGDPRNLQMVIKTTIPAEAILDIATVKQPQPKAKPAAKPDTPQPSEPHAPEQG